jgi:hypothetical protein
MPTHIPTPQPYAPPDAVLDELLSEAFPATMAAARDEGTTAFMRNGLRPLIGKSAAALDALGPPNFTKLANAVRGGAARGQARRGLPACRGSLEISDRVRT